MKKLLLLFALVSVSAFAQTQDCRVTFTFSNATGLVSSTPIDNRQAGCDNWVLQYQDSNVNPVNMTVESANATATCTGASYGAFSGTVSVGANPATSVTGTETRLAGYVACIRVTPTGTPAGTWTITGVLYGFRSGFISSTTSPGAGCPNPCPVIGTAADGAVASGAPVQSGGVDNAGNARHFSTNTNGVQSMGQAFTGADGVVNTNIAQIVEDQGGTAGPLLNAPLKFNGTTWDRDFVCNKSTSFNLAAGTDVVIVAGVSAQTTRICHLSFSGPTTANVTIQQGTGTTCLTGTAALSGAFGSVTSLALDFGTGAALRNTVAATDICLHFSVAVTIGGLAVYAEY